MLSQRAARLPPVAATVVSQSGDMIHVCSSSTQLPTAVPYFRAPLDVPAGRQHAAWHATYYGCHRPLTAAASAVIRLTLPPPPVLLLYPS